MDRRKEYNREIEELDQGTYEYFCNVLYFTEEEFNDKEDKAIFFKNVFNAMKGRELQLICHRRLSFAVSNLMKYVKEKKLLIMLGKVRDNFDLVARHPSGSHVLQALLDISLTRVTSPTEDHEKLIKRIVKFSVIARENLDELLKCSQSCHVICTLLEVLGGCRVSNKIAKGKKSPSFHQKGSKKGSEFGPGKKANFDKLEVPDKFSNALRKLISVLMKSDLNGILAESHSSLVVQTSILVLARCDPETCQQLIELLMSTLLGKKTNIMTLISSCVYSPLMQKIIEAFNPEQFSSFFENYFKGKLKEICTQPLANFVAQSLFQSCTSRNKLEEMFEELEISWPAISNARYLGVLVALSSACANVGCCQAKFVQNTCNVLHCSTPEEKELFVPLVIRWMTYEDYTDERNKNQLWKLNLHGSLLIQNILKFQKPFAVITSLFKMEPTALAGMFCTVAGSHVLDAFAESKTVGKEKKMLIIEKLKGCFIKLAMDKNGSRCLEKLWAVMDVKGKTPIVEELAASAPKLRDNKFGLIIYNSFGVEMFKRKPQDWEDWLKQGIKKKEMFKEILETDVNDGPKRKKQSKEIKKDILETDGPKRKKTKVK